MICIRSLTRPTSIAAALSVLVLGACGKSGSLILVAKNSDSLLQSKSEIQKGSAPQSALTTSTFKICVKKVSLEDESGEDHGNGSSEGETDEEKNEIEFALGEVELTDISTSDTTLGTIPDAPVGFKISKVKMKLKKFGSCAHSIEYGDKTTNADVEFRWRFNPAVEINSGDTLDLFMTNIVSKIAETTNIDHGNFRSAIQQVQASGKKR